MLAIILHSTTEHEIIILQLKLHKAQLLHVCNYATNTRLDKLPISFHYYAAMMLQVLGDDDLIMTMYNDDDNTMFHNKVCISVLSSKTERLFYFIMQKM